MESYSWRADGIIYGGRGKSYRWLGTSHSYDKYVRVQNSRIIYSGILPEGQYGEMKNH
jgi:hypothetical protein